MRADSGRSDREVGDCEDEGRGAVGEGIGGEGERGPVIAAGVSRCIESKNRQLQKQMRGFFAALRMTP